MPDKDQLTTNLQQSPQDCHYSVELLADLLDGLVDEPTQQEMRAHLQECDICIDVLGGIYAFREDEGTTDTAAMENYLNDLEKVQLARIEAGAEAEEVHSTTKVRSINTADTQKKSGSSAFPLFRIAASFLVFALLGAILYFFAMGPGLSGSGSLDPIAMADTELSKPYAISGVTRGDTETDKLVDHIMDRYNAQDYASTIKAIDALQASGNMEGQWHFYEGLCYLYQADAKPEVALSHLNMAASTKDTRYAQQAAWYSALAQLKAGKNEEAKAILERIVQSKGFKHKSAAELLKALK